MKVKPICFAFSTGILSVLFSCSKNYSTPEQEIVNFKNVISTEDARNWYEQQGVKNTSFSRNPGGKKPGGVPDWSRVFTVNVRQGESILKVAMNGFDQAYSYRDMLFKKEKNGRIQATILEIQLKPDYLDRKLKQWKIEGDIRRYVDNGDFTGAILQYNLEGQFIKGRLYQDGMVKAELRPAVNNATAISSRSSTNDPDDGDESTIDEGENTDPGGGDGTWVIDLPPVVITPDPAPNPIPDWTFPPDPVPAYPPTDPYPIGDPGGGGSGSGGAGGSSASFIMSPEDQAKYPRLTQMVKGLANYVKSNPNVLEALVKFSGLTKEQILEKVQFGKGPEIKLTSDLQGFAKFSQNEPNVIYLSVAYANGLEAAVLPGTQQATAFLLAVTTLHELVHYGRFFAGLPATNANRTEYGWEFERSAFKTVISEVNAGKYSLEFYQQ